MRKLTFITFLLILYFTGCRPSEDILNNLKIESLCIMDVSSADSKVVCNLDSEHADALDNISDLINESKTYTDDAGTTHLKSATITLDNKDEIILWYGTQGFITVAYDNEQFNIKNSQLENYLDELMLKYPVSQNSPSENTDTVYGFSDSDIENAKSTIKKYFKARNEKDIELLKSVMYTNDNRNNYSNEALKGNESFKLLKIYEYDPIFQSKFSYHKDKKDGNTIIIQVDYDVSLKNKNSPYNEGTYERWAFIMIREDINSPWLIYDQGY